MAAFLHGPDGNGISFAGSAVGRIDLPNITQAAVRSRTYCLMGRLTLARTYCLTSRTHWILFLSLTYEVLTTSQPDYLHNLISVQSRCRTHSSSAFILARPSVSPTALSHMRHLTCGISSLLHSVNLILFTVFLVHLILCTSPHHSYHLFSHHLSLPRPFTPDVKLISFTNHFLHSPCDSFDEHSGHLMTEWCHVCQSQHKMDQQAASVQDFQSLVSIHSDWLNGAEQTSASFKHPSKLVDHVVQQIEEYKVRCLSVSSYTTLSAGSLHD